LLIRKYRIVKLFDFEDQDIILKTKTKFSTFSKTIANVFLEPKDHPWSQLNP